MYNYSLVYNSNVSSTLLCKNNNQINDTKPYKRTRKNIAEGIFFIESPKQAMYEFLFVRRCDKRKACNNLLIYILIIKIFIH